MRLSLHSRNATTARRGGYVIFAVLIVVVVLSLVAYRFTDAMTAEYRASARTNDDAQAKLAAVSGLHYAAAVLSDRTSFFADDGLAGNPSDNADVFQGVPVQAAASGTGATRKQAQFDIRSVGIDDSGAPIQRFGAIDEGGKLNINSMIALDPTGNQLYNALMQLPNMTPDVADAIVDWVDADDIPRASGAESSDYQSMPYPYNAKNGPLNSLDELLLVKGVTPALLYGNDTNRNGIPDGNEADSSPGWSAYLTVYGRELNVDMTGTVRTYLNGDDLTTLQQQLSTSLGDDLTYYILAAKLFKVTQTDANGNIPTVLTGTATVGGNGNLTITMAAPTPPKPVTTATLAQLQAAVKDKMATTFTGGTPIKSSMTLVYSRITLPRPADAQPTDPDLVAFSPLIADAKAGGTLLASLMDKTTVKQAVEMVPRINVNTAPREVLLGVPGMTEAYADAIIAARASQVPKDPATVSGAWLITNAAVAIPPTTFQQMETFVTGSGMVYRVQSIGYFQEGGSVARMEAVIDTNQGSPRFLYVRDLADLENPRGFDPTNTNKTGP